MQSYYDDLHRRFEVDFKDGILIKLPIPRKMMRTTKGVKSKGAKKNEADSKSIDR